MISAPCWNGSRHGSADMPWSQHRSAAPSFSEMCARIFDGLAALLQQIQRERFLNPLYHELHTPSPLLRISSPLSTHPGDSNISSPEA